MQVKKFEAQTIQEALETIKRELGPDAIILQTKNIRGGFGLLSKSSIEVTAAVSEKSIHKKKTLENRLPADTVQAMQKLPASKQAEILESYPQKTLQRHPVVNRDMGSAANKGQKRITATRYIDIDTAPSPKSQPVAQPATQPRVVAEPKAQIDYAGASVMSNQAHTESLKAEVAQLKLMLGEMKTNQDQVAALTGSSAISSAPAFNNAAVRDAYELLVINGIDKKHAHMLVKQAVFALSDQEAQMPDRVMDQLAEELVANVEVLSLLEGIRSKTAEDSERPPVAIALLGPTGVGKTTTLAKIASDAVLNRGLKVALINVDSYKIAAADQLETYSKILNVPFRSVSNSEELQLALKEFNRFDLILLDTTGRSQRDMENLNLMRDLIFTIPDLRTALVMSATTRDTELYDIGKRFSQFKPGGLIVSKLDEALMYGAVYNVSQKLKLPLFYFTTGQRVPEDIEEATAERLTALILDL